MTDQENSTADQALGTDTEETEKDNDDETKLEREKVLLKLKREKRQRKTDMTKIRHHMEKLCITSKDAIAIEKDIEQLWSLLDTTLEILDELSVVYLENGDVKSQNAAIEESQSLELEIQAAIEKAHEAVKTCVQNSAVTVSALQGTSASNLTTPIVSEGQLSSGSPPTNLQGNYSGHDDTGASGVSPGGVSANNRLKPLKVPTYGGDKTKFEEFWGLFESLVDKSKEPANLKMARLRQCLFGNALESIRGLGISEPEYEEAKEILQSKFGGQRRQLRAYMDQLEKMASLRRHDVQGFEKFADLVRITVVKLQAEGREGELGEGTLHSLLVKKLTEDQVQKYSRWLQEQSRERSVLCLKDWLKEEVRIQVEAMEMSYGLVGKEKSENVQVPSKTNYRPKFRNFHVGSDLSGRSKKPPGWQNQLNRKPPCACCGSPYHGVWSCPDFQQKSYDDRWQFAKDKRLCFRCLAGDHQGRACTKSHMCQIDGCRGNHHRLLHESLPAISQPVDAAQSVVEGNAYPSLSAREGAASPPASPEGEGGPALRAMTTCNSIRLHEAYSLRTIPVWVKAQGKKVKVNAILDDASNESFLNEEVAGALGLRESYQTVKVHVLNNSVETFQTMPLTIEIESVNGQFKKEIEVKTCPRNVTGSYQVENWRASQDKWPHLVECDFPSPAKDGLVDLLIGVDNADLHYSFVDVRGRVGEPVARLGPLGWTCIGRPDGRVESGTRTHTIRTLLTREAGPVYGAGSCCELDQTLKRFWEIENYGTEPNVSIVCTEEEKLALEKVSSSVHYNNGRYSIAVPWKEQRPQLPNNRQVAESRLCSTERNLKKKEFVEAEYQKTIETYIEKGYLRRVPENEPPPPEVWYLPHFPIVKMSKSTTKVRIVFDCSAKCNGISLNDVIHAGPKLQRELFDVLIRFRRNPVALVCDIQEMYLQIEIKEEDRPLFRILWRDGETDREPDVYEFCRVVFGKNSAPMEAQFIAQENARRHRTEYPSAAETVLQSTYMDDSLDSVEEDEKGIELYHELSALWAKAGMHARKWVSNSDKVMAVIPEEDRATEVNIRDNKDTVTSTLGLQWNSTEDVFVVPAIPAPFDYPITKRSVLKKVATVFDPLGLISPFIVQAKIMLQELWHRGYDWDEEVEDEVANRIQNWFSQLPCLANVKAPRGLRNQQPVKSREVVTFVDASQQAYGAVSYLRCEYADGSVTSRLIASKSKVAPLTPMTIPRLELMGAIVGLRLTQSVSRALEVPVKAATFYSDSTDVLWWIRGRGRDFRPFVANRIGEIQISTEPVQWQHVPTEQNPADLCSRGSSPSELAESPLWWDGPEWLRKEKDAWPKMQQADRPKVMQEMKAVREQEREITAHVTVQTNPIQNVAKPCQETNSASWRLDPKRFSSWSRLVGVHARVRRALHNMSKKGEKQTSKVLLPHEIREAEEEVVRSCQREAFHNEYKALASGKSLPPKSPLIKLNPMLDEDGCIRSNGRLQFAEYLPYDVRFPMVLPRGHWVTKLIVKHYHEQANHSAGTNFVLSQVSERYWIIAAREEIREWEGECNTCKRRKNKTSKQIMAPLPKIRLRFTFRPFDQTAVDYAGPFTTVQGRGVRRQKRWLCLFTCLSTRAVHLEVAFGLDTDSFLNAFTRFTSRRGVPTEMVSDCGTNFVGAVSELKELVSQLDQDRIQQITAYRGVKWNFNPPGAPHFGGIHEAMIKSAKKAIYGILGTSDVTDEELITVVVGAESLLNSRPLTYQSADPRDVVPLTPNHFLHGQLGGQFAPETVDTTDFSPRKRWRRVQEIISQVWRRWLQEYLPLLSPRPKWTEVVKDLKKDDVVLVLDPKLPRGQWPLGRITETYPGRDGHTRVAKIQCGTKTVVRPIHKLVPLQEH